MTRVRVLVAEDSLTVRRRLCEILSADDELEVVGEAEDGQSTIELCSRLRPNIVTLDMMMPGLTGLAATEFIMANVPTPILIVSASTNRGELFKTYDALAAGAVDVLDKPKGDEFDSIWEERFVSSVKLVSRIRVITHLRAKLKQAAPSLVAPTRQTPFSRPESPYRLIALGASTGGPPALVQVLRTLPTGLGVPILMVLHIDEPFGSAFAEWLDRQSPHRVAYAEEGAPVSTATGRVVMAPPGRHLTLAAGRLRLTDGPPRHSCRPSVDVLFESLAKEYGGAAVACLLTGMGRDGAAGLLAMRQAGGYTIAQDEATCVVYGMPREAALLGAARSILPLGEIGSALGQLLSGKGGGTR